MVENPSGSLCFEAVFCRVGIGVSAAAQCWKPSCARLHPTLIIEWCVKGPGML
jgi:hypothetical protein